MQYPYYKNSMNTKEKGNEGIEKQQAIRIIPSLNFAM